jgi:hypothetical protein
MHNYYPLWKEMVANVEKPEYREMIKYATSLEKKLAIAVSALQDIYDGSVYAWEQNRAREALESLKSPPGSSDEGKEK